MKFHFVSGKPLARAIPIDLKTNKQKIYSSFLFQNRYFIACSPLRLLVVCMDRLDWPKIASYHIYELSDWSEPP